MGSALKTPIKCISSFLSKLNCVTNSGTHSSETEMLFQNRNNSTNHSMNSSCSQYTASSKTTAQSADEMQNRTRRRQAPPPPRALVTTLQPMLKDFQLRPGMAVERKSTDMRQAPPALSPTKKRQAPLPPLSPTKVQQAPSSQLIARLEQMIKADKQSTEGAAWHARHNPASISSLEQMIKADKQSSDGAAWYARHSNTVGHSPKVRRIPMPSLAPALTTELEQMASNTGIRIRNDSTGIIPTKVRQSLLPSLLIKKPEKMVVNDKQSASNTIPAKQVIFEELRMALNDFHQNPEMAREKWISAGNA